MSQAKAKQLIEKMAKDDEFRDKVASAKTREEKRKIMEANGFGDLTKEDIQAAAPQGEQELTDEDLDAVAGGSTAQWAQASAEVAAAAF